MLFDGLGECSWPQINFWKVEEPNGALKSDVGILVKLDDDDRMA